MLASCGGKNSATINGHLASCMEDTIYLEAVSATNGVTVIDSAIADHSGSFSFKVQFNEPEAAIYNVRTSSDIMTLLLAPGEEAELFSVCDNARHYGVEGSSGSALIKELTSIMYDGMDRMDSLRWVIMRTAEDARDAVIEEYYRAYINTKQAQINFIIGNSSSPAAIYALYQRLPGDEVLFNGETDIVYYRMVADSVSASNPGSPYLVPLKEMIARYDKKQELLLAMDSVNAVDFIDFEMPDIYGNKIRFSSIDDKAILLYFWSATSDVCKKVNLDLKEVYADYAGRGFEILQVCIDDSKPLWVTTVQDQKLPWISVSDLKGMTSPVIGDYNISKVPSNFLFDRQGKVVGKDIFGEELTDALKNIL